ncbi:OTU-like cysteine protease-like protein 2 [Elsinoe fawcettii]|nr:OTU-like cysteine protease-like protein 2 [Elsinoe fawcettii]
MGGYEDEFPLLAAMGLYAANIRGDGNCLFNALSDQVYGAQDRHLELRGTVIDYIRNHPDDFKPFLDVKVGGGQRRVPKRKVTLASAIPASPTKEDVEKAFQEYLVEMAKGGIWGGNLELQAYASATNTDIHIYQREYKYVIPPKYPTGETRTAAHIAYHSWEHYSSIRNLDGPHTGIPHVQVKPLSPDEEEKQKKILSEEFPVQAWQINALLNSLPFLIDKQLARRTLQGTKGDLNAAYAKLADSEDGGSASSAQESSSIEREADSDDESLHAPNKKQDRRMSRSSRQRNLPTYDPTRLTPFDPLSDSGSQESIESTPSDALSSADVSRIGQQDRSMLQEDTINVKTDGDPPQPPKRPLRIKLNPPKPPDPNSKSRQKQTGPRRITARDKKDMKKQAQKAARKERQQAAAGGVSRTMKTGMELRSQVTGETKPIESGFRTLFI